MTPVPRITCEICLPPFFHPRINCARALRTEEGGGLGTRLLGLVPRPLPLIKMRAGRGSGGMTRFFSRSVGI